MYIELYNRSNESMKESSFFITIYFYIFKCQILNELYENICQNFNLMSIECSKLLK